MSIASILIHKEMQFNNLRNKYADFAGCASTINLCQIKNNLIVILATQRTGSQLLCQDLGSALRLEYSPDESFIPLLQGVSAGNIAPGEVEHKIINTIEKFADSEFTIIKFMIDYVGWLGYFCADREDALYLEYSKLSALFLEQLKTIDNQKFSCLIRLDRKNKLKQAVSRFINTMGLPTHIETNEQAIDFENQLSRKLARLPNYQLMIIDQLRIILGQICLLDDCLSSFNGFKDSYSLELESDLIEKRDTYLFSLFESSGFSLQPISRRLVPTSGKLSKSIFDKLLEVVSPSS